MNRDDIAQMRRSYTLAGLDEHSIASSPFAQFSQWFEEARTSISGEANAMTLATVNPDNTPSARIVLLKDMDERGFVFYTNYDSAKGQAIAQNPHVSLSFFWSELERQVRIAGKAEKISRGESDTYFQSRPLESRLGAWASAQSSVIEGREVLEKRFAALQQEYADAPIPLPPFWGGYRVVPYEMEFWQGRVGRLHDRLVYRLAEAGEWRISRRAP